MPAKSKAQQQAMAIALHQPSKLYKRNQGMLGMSYSDLQDFASTKRTGLPQISKSAKKMKNAKLKKPKRISI